MGAAAAFVRSHYLSSVRKALDVIRSSSLEKSRAVLALLQKLAEQVIFYATTGRKSLSLVASYQDKQELLLGVVGTGPIYGGNVPLLKTWVEKLSAALEKVAAHFLTGKPYNDRLLADFAAVSEEVGMYSSEPVADSLAGLRSLNMSPVTLKEVDVNFLLLDFKSGFGDLYSVRVLLALCESFSPEQVNTVPICEVVTKPLWTVIDATVLTIPCYLPLSLAKSINRGGFRAASDATADPRPYPRARAGAGA
ncbi:hypothetical protein B484DRAFT_243918 [Ochromonadaceae sp. CCMP2298]|nr:hypothetical protein B484DRAFT_243918 [Ochromonadaceae sp. CCMP2298]